MSLEAEFCHLNKHGEIISNKEILNGYNIYRIKRYCEKFLLVDNEINGNIYIISGESIVEISQNKHKRFYAKILMIISQVDKSDSKETEILAQVGDDVIVEPMRTKISEQLLINKGLK